LERKRVHTAGGSPGAGSALILVANIDESNGVNVHNIHLSVTVEPEDADANSQGQWVLWCLPDKTSGAPSTTLGALEAEGSNAFYVAGDLWSASNQTPFVSGDVTFKTTRNCQNGARLVLTCHVEGTTAGLNSVHMLLTYNTKSL